MAEYLLSVHHVEGEEMPTSMEEIQPIFDAVERFNADLKEAGAWVFAGGLQPRETSTMVDATREGEPLVTDGPFVEAKEWLGGFWVIDVADLDAALDWARRGSAACQGPVEVRPFQGE